MNTDWLYKRPVLAVAWGAALIMLVVVLMASGRQIASGVTCPPGLKYNYNMGRCDPIPTATPWRTLP